MNIGPKRTTCPVELTPEDVQKAIEEYIRKADSEIVFPAEYDVMVGPVIASESQWPAISIKLEIVEPRKPGRPKGSKQKPNIVASKGDSKGPLTEAQANHIVVTMGASWDDLPDEDASGHLTDKFWADKSWEAKLDGVGYILGKDWREWDKGNDLPVPIKGEDDGSKRYSNE